ncbi:hypothetical protein DFP72DRAFT_954579 [Ephemerocybe angulata]|uniref:VWFA domain-containing protein n=1 Tax=Ephemerocybe angulata TaxID=980116 RepID=A0A8H6IFY3_9AGAR|nr:hypothetical protein DFP72DRAFT_954579 [Tulosesus angulatus]
MSQHSSSSKGKGKVSRFLSTVFKSDKGKSLNSDLPSPGPLDFDKKLFADSEMPLPADSEMPLPAYSDSPLSGSSDFEKRVTPVESDLQSGSSVLHKSEQSPAHPYLPPSYDRIIVPEELAKLTAYDTIFLVDDSSSMDSPVNSSNSKTRWQKATDCVIKYANTAARYDADGVDIHFLNRTTFRVSNCNTQLTTEEEIANLFRIVRPYGGTPLGRRLRELLEEDKERLKLSKKLGTSVKPRNYIIITDGAPDNQDEVIQSIKRIAKRLDVMKMPNNQLGFQFVQVGDDLQATMFLEALDEGIEGVRRDIIDTVKTSDLPSAEDDEAFVTKLLLGGIDRFHDGRGVKAKQAVNKYYVPQNIPPGK